MDFLQQNWALIDSEDSGGVIIWFLGDTSGVFDELRFPSEGAARLALMRNGFRVLQMIRNRKISCGHQSRRLDRQPILTDRSTQGVASGFEPSQS
jgi:hypothetical protein